MALVDIILMITFYGCITAGVTSYLLFRRLQSPVRTRIRVHMSGGTEKMYNAVEQGEEILYIVDGEEHGARVPIDILPGHASSWGVHYRVFDLIHGSDEVMKVPWLVANISAKHLKGDDAAKERYRRRVRALNAFRQLTSGLSSINRWQAVALIALGTFAGLYLAPMITGAIT